MQLHLENHVVVVTGGSSGIGWSCVKQFLEEGAIVAIWDRARPSAQQFQSLTDVGRAKLHSLPADISDATQIAAALRETMQLDNRVNHLVHAAAIGSGKFGFPFTNLEPEDWLKTLEVNIMGTVRVCHAVGPVMREQKHGSICLIASVAGQIGSQTDPPYSASKAANINFAQCIAKDLASYGVRVNVVNPGMVQTPLNRSVWKAWQDQQPLDMRMGYDAWAEEKIKKVVPLGRWQTVEDIANMVIFLASERARSVTGQCLNVDGGFVMHS